jgi:hypothetical protein
MAVALSTQARTAARWPFAAAERITRLLARLLRPAASGCEAPRSGAALPVLAARPRAARGLRTTRHHEGLADWTRLDRYR